MAHVRDSARSYGKSDPIDALAVARAALREPDLPTARLDGPAREVRLLVSHREDLVAERTRIINRLRWHLHELDPAWKPPARSLWPAQTPGRRPQPVCKASTGWSRAWRAHCSQRCRMLSEEIAELDHETRPLVARLAPALIELLRLRDADRSEDPRRDRRRRPVPLPPRLRPTQRHRAGPGLVRQPRTSPAVAHRKSAAQHGPAPHRHHPGALPPTSARVPPTPPRRGDTKAESIRALKRRLSDVVYRALLADACTLSAAGSDHHGGLTEEQGDATNVVVDYAVMTTR